MNDLATAIAAIPPGGWAVGVSGGADSVALLLLICDRQDLQPHVVHLDHQMRGQASAEDAAFVRALAQRLGVPVTIARREDLEQLVPSLPANRSARFRALRMVLFNQVVTAHGLGGVLLAHHADDVAETILHRLLRGSGPAGLTGISPQLTVGGLHILRPLLEVRRERLREMLRERGQAWREDASNTSDAYARNRLRKLLAGRPGLSAALLKLGHSCRTLRDWTRRAAPGLPPEVDVKLIRALPPILAIESVRRWLIARGVPERELTPSVIARLLDMAHDAASPPGQHFPGGVLIRRRRGVLFVGEQ